MSPIFRRRKHDAEPDDATPTSEPSSEPTTAGPDDERGPWDVSDVPGLGARLDLGALRVPARPGLELRMEVEKTSRQVVAASLTAAGSSLQVQALAAPRTDGLWEELRTEIAASVTQQGGTADEVEGPFGPELLARLPVRTADGRTGHRPARFIGVDGPRWFLRGVLSGRAAVDPDAATLLEDVFADIVVVRGQEARAPRDVLALRMPGATDAAAPATAGEPPVLPDPLTRGPEITETR
ncbi:DUF3710 domain-containing protein [Georgenia faecalis]|uniref:DUF3710 domain-containing protein n=1 Tax=Georgenia faecalis TaxID=2483799 RepID=A0ABV9DAY5_9MICO|nr:DUF3710 domain-containing protein [Georgenia faecalis]